MYLTYRDAAQAANELLAAPTNATQWLLCVADCHADEIPALLDACRQRNLQVCGGLFPGLIQGAHSRDSGIVAVPLPTGSQLAVACLHGGAPEWTTPPPSNEPTRFDGAILLVDCLAPNVTGLLEDIYDRYGNQVHHIGAGTGYHDLRPEPTIFTADGLHTHAALMITLPRHITLGVRHGWRRVAGPFVASRTQGNVIQELNWEPAGSFYLAQVDRLDATLADKPIFPDIASSYPLCMAKEGSEDIMRDPVCTTAEDEVVVLSDVPENSLMYLAHGDCGSLIEAARQAVDDCDGTHDVAHCFISDCYSRALKLGDDFDRELQTVCETVAELTTVAPEGVQALGEIAANGTQKLELFNKTIVVGLIHSDHG